MTVERNLASSRSVAFSVNTRTGPNVVLLSVGSFIFFFVGSGILWFFQQYNFVASAEAGIPIPDGVNITETLDNLFRTVGFGRADSPFIGLELIYGWTWSFHPALTVCVNWALMGLSISIFVKFVIQELHLPWWSIFGLVGNPYLFLACSGPNKEIPLVAITVLFVVLVHRRSVLSLSLAFGLSLLAFFIRDGHGVFLGCFVIASVLLRYEWRAVTISVCGVCIAAASFFGVLRDFVPLVSRNIDGFEAVDRGFSSVGVFAGALNLDQYSVFGGFVLFFIRIVYNLLSLAFFPVIRTTSGLHLLGISYWLFGLIIFISLLSCIFNLGRFKQIGSAGGMLLALSVGTLFMISVSLFVQPRYLMPIMPMAFSVLAMSDLRVRVLSVLVGIGLSFVVIVFYFALGLNPLPGFPVHYDNPVYIL